MMRAQKFIYTNVKKSKSKKTCVNFFIDGFQALKMDK